MCMVMQWDLGLEGMVVLGFGLLIRKGLFGWATQEGLQLNIEGLSRDGALPSSVLTTALVALMMRRLARRADDQQCHGGGW